MGDVESSFTFSVAAFSSDPLRQLEGTVRLTVYLSQLCDERHAHLVLRSALASHQRILEYHVLSEERWHDRNFWNSFGLTKEGRRKKEEGRRKKEEGRKEGRKEGRRKEGRRRKKEG